MSQRIPYGAGGGGKGGGGGQTQRAATEAPNTLRSNTMARVLIALSEGEIDGFTIDGVNTIGDARAIYFDGTPMLSPDGTVANMQGVTWALYTGTANQAPFLGFPQIEQEVEVSTEVTQSVGPIVRTINNLTCTSARVTMRLPNLAQQMADTGDVVGTMVQIMVEVQASTGPYIVVVDPNGWGAFQGKCVAPYERSFVFALPGVGPWNIRVTRYTPDSASAALQNKTFWASMTEITDYLVQYANTAILALTFDAQLTGGRIPRITTRIKGIKCQVPVNFDPISGSFTGVWDGTFKVAWTNDPAWIFYDVCTNPRYGLGRYINAAQVDKWTLYTISQYNNQYVPNGTGGYEKRYVFNGDLNQSVEAYLLLQAVASAFRGAFYWSAGTIVPVQDSPKSPVCLVTPANALMGSIDYGTSSHKGRPTVARVTYNDKDDGFKAQIEPYQDSPRVSRFGWRPTDMQGAGLTQRSYARRHGMWIVETAWRESDTLVYRPSLDHAFVKPGDIVSVMDPKWTGIEYGGRIASATTISMTLDRAVVIEAGKSYSVTITMPDGTLATRQLTNAPGTFTVLTWLTALTQAPIANAVWILASSTLSPRLFRVLGITEPARNVLEVTCNFFDPNKFTYIENNIILDEPVYSAIPKGVIAPPGAPQHHEFRYKEGAGILSGLDFTWTPSPDSRVTLYEAQYAFGSGAYQEMFVGAEISTTLRAATPDNNYYFRVRAMDGAGRSSVWVTVGPFPVTGAPIPPEDMTNVQFTALGNQAHFTWDLSVNLDVLVGGQVRIRWAAPSISGATYATSVDVGGYIAGSASSAVVPLANGVYFFKFVNSIGDESANAYALATNLPDIIGRTQVVTTRFDPTWPGTLVNMSVVSGLLQLASIGMWDDIPNFDAEPNIDGTGGGVQTSGSYTYSSYTDLGAVYTARVVSLLATLTFLSLDLIDARVNNIDDWDTFDGLIPIGACNMELQISTTLTDPGVSPVWGPWSAVVIGDYTMRAYRLRIMTTSVDKAYNIAANIGGITVDVPNRLDSGPFTTSSAGDVTVPYNGRFWAPPLIPVLTWGGYVSGDVPTIVSNAPDSFVLNIMNGGVRVIRSGTWVTSGYGKGP